MVYRVDVAASPAYLDGRPDPAGEGVRAALQAEGLAVAGVAVERIFLIDSPAAAGDVARVALPLLADPITEIATLGGSGGATGADGGVRVEVHLKPGVMDPVAASTEAALRDLGLAVSAVRTGRAYVLRGVTGNVELAVRRALANVVIEHVYLGRHTPTEFPAPPLPTPGVRRVALRELDDAGLAALSRSGHLFLDPAEMRAIRDHYRGLGREPTDVELETLAQTWSEHCVHKTLKSAVEVTDPAGDRRYRNLIKETIFAATQTLIERGDAAHCLSVFKDNAGVIALDETDAVCFKVETHNRPSAIDPYGGAATGVGGCIRDVMGTGLGAKPIANTDVFAVAHPGAVVPDGVIGARRTLEQVVAGVRDYGNRMGIPTVNGAVVFDDRHAANPLVFCGCVGLLPRDKVAKGAVAGDAVVVIGGRTGRDGIHGATFSSAELTSTHADEFGHAVQIGNAITQKKVLDVLLVARDRGLYTCVTDCGAGGLSSAVGEMGEALGAVVELDRVPLKYQGLRYDEIWISEAQERMVVSVPQARVAELLALAASEDVEATVIGTFGGGELVLRYGGEEVGRLDLAFMHRGLPMPTRRATVVAGRGDVPSPAIAGRTEAVSGEGLKAVLGHPNVASKHWIIRQYDHEVGGATVVKPLVGALLRGPSDAAVLRPKADGWRGVAVGCGLAPWIEDPYAMALAGIDEAVRNVVAVGGDPDTAGLLDNFCWPGTDEAGAMGALVRAAEACRDAALAYRIPFISGKDSLHNQYTDKRTGKVTRIPYTLLISAIAVVKDIRRCVTMDLKAARSMLVLVRPRDVDAPTLESLGALHRAVARVIAGGRVRACHDVSDGGVLTAAAEMAIASRGLGVHLLVTSPATLWSEARGQYLLEVSAADSRAVFAELEGAATVATIGDVTDDGRLTVPSRSTFDEPAVDVAVEALAAAWRGTLDW